jgi:hypothetical protein
MVRMWKKDNAAVGEDIKHNTIIIRCYNYILYVAKK